MIRCKSNRHFHRRYSRPSDRTTGIICALLSVLSGFYSAKNYPTRLGRMRCKDERGRTLVFLTNTLELNAVTISELCRGRWPVELFFKWIEQHLRIKAFSGTSENATKSQLWIKCLLRAAYPDSTGPSIPTSFD